MPLPEFRGPAQHDGCARRRSAVGRAETGQERMHAAAHWRDFTAADRSRRWRAKIHRVWHRHCSAWRAAAWPVPSAISLLDRATPLSSIMAGLDLRPLSGSSSSSRHAFGFPGSDENPRECMRSVCQKGGIPAGSRMSPGIGRTTGKIGHAHGATPWHLDRPLRQYRIAAVAGLQGSSGWIIFLAVRPAGLAGTLAMNG